MSVRALLSNMVLSGRGILINRVIAPGQQMMVHKEVKPVELPKEPKRPLRSYFQYMTENRPILQKQHPEWKLTEVVKQLANNWRNMDIKAKEKYEETYRKNVVAYEEQHSKYMTSLSPEQLDALNKIKENKRDKKNRRTVRKLWRDTNKPKRPLTNFGHFIKEKAALPECKGQKLSDILTKYKDVWNSLPDDEREKYTKMFRADQERYNKEIEKWEKKMIEEGKRTIVRKDTNVVSSTKIKPQ